MNQWLFLVPLKGGRDYITPQKAIYKWYISGIYCQLGDYILQFPEFEVSRIEFGIFFLRVSYMGVNPRIMGVLPPNHPLKNRVFHFVPSILGSYFWKHPYLHARCFMESLLHQNFGP